MRKKSKKFKSDYCSYNKRRKKSSYGYCIYIGKENLERWNDLKMQLNFMSNSEFTTFLLDLLVSEKCNFIDKSLPIKTNISESNSDEVITDSKTNVLPLKHSSSVNENCSSVIVVNKASKTDLTDGVQENEVNVHSLEDMPVRTNKVDQLERITADHTKTDFPNFVSESINKCDEIADENILMNCRSTERSYEKKNITFNMAEKPLPSNENKPNHKKKCQVRNNERFNSDLPEEENKDIMQAQVMRPAQVESQRNTICEQVSVPIKRCVHCEIHHAEHACPLKKPILLVHDAVTHVKWCESGDNVKSYAEASLPTCLELRQRQGDEEGYIVVAKQPFQAFYQFGPLVGVQIKEKEIPDDATMEHIWEVTNDYGSQFLSTSDPKHSNWLRFVRPAPVRSSRNMEVVLNNNQLVFVTTTSVTAGEELLFWAESTNSAWSQKKLCKTKCGGCNLSFSHTLYYRLHCAVFHDPAYSLTVRKHHCKVCGLSVLGKENIVKHAYDNHNGKGAYQCQFCNKFFLRLNYLEMHRTYGCSANPNRARPLCDYCGRKFCQPQKLKVHIKRMHSEMLDVLRDFQCQRCLKVLGSRPALQRHVKEVHQKDVVGASTCDRCGKMFQNKSNLKIHMLTHSGIKPFKCKEEQCQAAFTTKQCLQLHYRKVHRLEGSCMPLIQRSVEYTLDAYSGSRRPNTDSQYSSDTGEDTLNKCLSLSPTISVTSDTMDDIPFEAPNKTVISKGSKKWMGESADSSKTSVFDFNEDCKDQNSNVLHTNEEPIPMLIHPCKQDSTNASLLVEAALDAAEKDIDIPNKIHSSVSITSEEPYTRMENNVAHSPLSMSRPVSSLEDPFRDQSQSPHLAVDSCYSTSMSPKHPYSLMFPERTLHYDFRLSPPPSQMENFHLDEPRYELQRRLEETSRDEGLSEVQNLSLGLKGKSLQMDIPYKYEAPEERFESLEGLDMSRTGSYHHSFASPTPRYPHAMYEPRNYSHIDVLRVVNFSHSVDLSLPRSHHQLTTPISHSQTIMEPIRLLSPPPSLPLYQAYPIASSPYNRPISPTYNHYNTTY